MFGLFFSVAWLRVYGVQPFLPFYVYATAFDPVYAEGKVVSVHAYFWFRLNRLQLRFLPVFAKVYGKILDKQSSKLFK